MNKISIKWAIGAIALLASCSQTPQFAIEGVVVQAEGEMLYLQSLAADRAVVIDSVQLDTEGEFSFAHPATQYPEFYRLALGGEVINLSIDSTETVVVNSQSHGFSTSYRVEGSDNCTKIQTISSQSGEMREKLNALDIKRQRGKITAEEYNELLAKDVEAYKKELASLVYENPQATAAYYAIFQRINGLVVFSPYNKEDFRAIGAVATSYQQRYPEWYRTTQLKEASLKGLAYIKSAATPAAISEMEIEETSFIEIELPDVYKKNQKLSDQIGKVVLLDFTAYQTEAAPAYNRALAALYDKYHKKGFEIYQVSLDNHVNFWQVAASNLPWICVRDPQSVQSRAAMSYNVTALPTAYLFNREGEIVLRVEDLKKLDGEIAKLL